jgi:hypothetical protein
VTLADQGPGRAGGNRDLGAADVVEHADRVGGCFLERLITGDRRHAE